MNTDRFSKNAINQRVRASVRADAAYHTPAVSDVVKLDANESPYSLPSSLQAKWLECLSDIELNRYPDGPASELVDTVRRVWRVPEQHDIMIGNGSDELIQIVELGLAGPGGKVMTPAPTFVVYQRTAALIGASYLPVALDENFQIDLDSFLSAIDEHDPDCIFLASPNNPTGNSFDGDSIDQIASRAEGLVVVDEAYGMFAETPSLARLDRHENVVIMRTLSKIGFAGLRIGVLIGRREWINELHKVRPPYNINALSQASAIFALEHEQELEQHIVDIVAERRRLVAALSQVVGIHVFPTDANFVLVRATGKHNAAQIYGHLLGVGIAVKNLDVADTPLADCLRISIGSRAENDLLVRSLGSMQ